jgi:CheY-like chemotaxis protein
LEQHIEDVSVGPAPGQRILIADDNEVVRKGVCNILRSGLKVEAAIQAVNGKEAVEKARELNLRTPRTLPYTRRNGIGRVIVQ